MTMEDRRRFQMNEAARRYREKKHAERFGVGAGDQRGKHRVHSEPKIGDNINRWSVISAAPADNLDHPRFLCRCNCGTERIVRSDHLSSGSSRSCGCYSSERSTAMFTKHGEASRRAGETSEYKCWASMISRCENWRVSSYKDYGGRGIKVCERWRSRSGHVGGYRSWLSTPADCCRS